MILPDLAIRLPENPLITCADIIPSTPGTRVVTVSNAATATYQGQVILILRVGETVSPDSPLAAYMSHLSHLRLARSTDGIHFRIDPKPFLYPSTEVDEWGCEDPRATLIGDLWHITYVSVSRLGMSTSLITTKDFSTLTHHGMIFLPDHKDVALFPELSGGGYTALTRPMPASFDRVHTIWLARSTDLAHWGEHTPLVPLRPGLWDSLRCGAGAVPLLTPEGWLEIYHGVNQDNHYALGALLLDPSDPTKVLGRSPVPLLTPKARWEQQGLVPHVVFTCGLLPLDHDRIRLYYGAADQIIAAADCSIEAILATLVESKSREDQL